MYHDVIEGMRGCFSVNLQNSNINISHEARLWGSKKHRWSCTAYSYAPIIKALVTSMWLIHDPNGQKLEVSHNVDRLTPIEVILSIDTRKVVAFILRVFNGV